MSFFADSLAALNHGAALVYHKLLQVEQDVTKWEKDNPAVAPLINAGVAHAETLLEQHGLPVTQLARSGDGLVAALRVMAANDATVSVKPVVAAPATPPSSAVAGVNAEAR